MLRRRLILAAVVLAVLVTALVYRRVSEERAERARVGFVKQFVESVRTDGTFHDPFVEPVHRDGIAESRPRMSEHYRLTLGPESAGLHDYHLEFDNGARGTVWVGEGGAHGRTADLYVWYPAKDAESPQERDSRLRARELYRQ